MEMAVNSEAVVVVGAGAAGLVCARNLYRAGVPVTVLEAGAGIGGDLRTARDDDGFSYDRGFQVVLAAYPALRRAIDLDALDGTAFDSGAMLYTGRRLAALADPLRHPLYALRDVTSSVFPFADKVRLVRWALESKRAGWQSAADAANAFPNDRSALDELRIRGFSEAFINRFARPFWGGISLDPSLGFSAGILRFTLKMFLEGPAILPPAGVQAVPAALAAELPADAIRTSTHVSSIIETDGRVTGVRVDGGQDLPASAVVIATDPRSARSLTGIDQIPRDSIGCVTVYMAGTTDPGLGRMLAIDATGRLHVNHLAPISGVQPAMALPGSHLLAAVLLGDAVQEWTDERIERVALDDVATLLGQPGAWTVRRIVRLPNALYRQPPGIHRRLPEVTTGRPGLFLAGSATVDASLNGALLSGETAARAVRNLLPHLT